VLQVTHSQQSYIHFPINHTEALLGLATNLISSRLFVLPHSRIQGPRQREAEVHASGALPLHLGYEGHCQKVEAENTPLKTSLQKQCPQQKQQGRQH